MLRTWCDMVHRLYPSFSINSGQGQGVVLFMIGCYNCYRNETPVDFAQAGTEKTQRNKERGAGTGCVAWSFY